MIKVDKDIAAIPVSLMLPLPDLFPAGTAIPRPARTTHERRTELINNGSYIDEPRYNDRYKQQDTKIAIEQIYNHKCAYCEQRIEQSHVEHYRPKKVYYWLAYSWDNLILACPTCNQNKGINFEINGDRATFVSNEDNIRNIHTNSTNYDVTEQPMMINPEVTDPAGFIRFRQNGNIEADEARFAYTIEKCKIDRPDLNDQRRALLNSFREDIRSALLENTDPIHQEVAIKTIVSKFIRDANNSTSAFLAFKRFAYSARWLNEIIKEMN